MTWRDPWLLLELILSGQEVQASIPELVELVKLQAHRNRREHDTLPVVGCASEFRELYSSKVLREIAKETGQHAATVFDDTLSAHVDEWNDDGTSVSLEEVRRFLNCKGSTYKNLQRRGLLPKASR